MNTHDALKAIEASNGLVKEGRSWRAGNVEFSRAEVWSLYSAGYFNEHKSSNVLTLTNEYYEHKRRISRPLPCVGSTVTFRVEGWSYTKIRRWLHGRVLVSSLSHGQPTALVHVGNDVYEVRQTSTGNLYGNGTGTPRWKGSKVDLGRYRNTVLWSIVERFLPAEWSAPPSYPQYTIGRLCEVRLRLNMICAPAVTDEEVASAALGLGYDRFEESADIEAHIKYWLSNDYLVAALWKVARHSPNQYLRQVYETEQQTLLEGVRRHLRSDVARTVSQYMDKTLEAPSFDLVKAEHANWPEDIVREWYDHWVAFEWPYIVKAAIKRATGRYATTGGLVEDTLVVMMSSDVSAMVQEQAQNAVNKLKCPFKVVVERQSR